MPQAVFQEWQAYDRLSPIDFGWRMEVAAGMLAALQANIHRDTKRRPEAYAPADFMPDWDGELRPKKEPGQIWQSLKAIAKVMGLPVVKTEKAVN